MQVGTPRELYERPASCFVADFLGQTNFLPAKVTARSADVITLETKVGTIHSKTFPADVEQGVAVTCSIRPESARILENGNVPGRGNSDDNSLEGKLTDSVYQGHIAQHTLDVSNTFRLSVHELRPRMRYEAGESLRVTIRPEDVVVLKDTPPKR